MVTVIDICVLTGAGLVGGICIGLLIRDKQIKNLKKLFKQVALKTLAQRPHHVGFPAE